MIQKIRPIEPHLLVKDPISRVALKPEGELKNITVYWRRRLNEKSVVVVEESTGTIATSRKRAETNEEER